MLYLPSVRRALFAVCMLVLAAAPGSAADSRFVLKPAGDGFIRLDTETGHLTHCRQQQAEWTCTGLDGGSPVPEHELKRLRERNEALSQRIEHLEHQVDRLADQLKQPGTELRLPSDDEMDQVFGFMEKFLRRFKELGRTLSGPPSKDI